MSAMKITFENKAAIQNDASVARKNKVADEDMNEIKQVVNNNADEVTTMQENIEDLQNGQGTASADITSLKNRVSTLETDNTQNKSDISELQSDNETNKANISSLQEQFSNFENYDDTEIKEDIKNLQSNDIIQDELISKLKSVALNAETEESKSLHVTDANKFGQLEVLGNHGQKTRDGYNILPNNLTNTTINGVTFTINEDKSVTVNGTATASIIANLITGEYNDNNVTEPLIIPDNITNCRLSGCPSGGSSSTYKLDIYNQKYELLATDWGEGTNVTIDSQEDKKIARVRIIIYSGATVNNLTFKPMLVAGTEEREYEQYGASPSPEYPSKIVCLGSNKQLFNKDDMNTLQGYIDGRGTIIYHPSNKIAYIECPKNTDITVSGKYLRGIACYNQLPTYSLQTSVKNINQATYLTLNTGDNTYLAVWYYENNSGYTEQEIIDSIKVEEGTEATSYSPYGQGSTLISKINKNFLNLNNLEVANNNGIDAYNIDNANQITLKNKATNSGIPYSYSFQAFKLNLPAGNYNLSAKVNTNSSNYRIVIRGKKNGNNITSVAVLTQVGNDGNFNIDYSKCDEYTIELYANQDYVEQLATTTYYDIQIQKGNTATEYVEHKQEDYLLYIQREMLKGDYFEKEADGWKEVHGFGKYVFDGTESYIKSSLSDDNYLRAYTNGNTISSSIMEMDGKMFATRYNSIGIYSSTTTDNRIACRPQLHTQISTEFLTENTAEAYKALLEQWKNEGDPLVIYYELQTPTKLACTEEQSVVLEELSNLDLFEGVNNVITAEDIALLKLKYALDVKTYVNNQLANVNAQILNIV